MTKRTLILLAALTLAIPAVGQRLMTPSSPAPGRIKPFVSATFPISVTAGGLAAGDLAKDAVAAGDASPSDGVVFVSASGADANTGLTWGMAKRTLAAAVNALPRCEGGSWSPCGTVIIGAGSYDLSAPLALTSPFITFIGQGNHSTVVNYTGTSGCAFQWTGRTNAGHNDGLAGGIYSLAIDGTKAEAGTCGVHAYDLIGFHLVSVIIKNFTGGGSSGLWEDDLHGWDERWVVSAQLANNTLGWKMTDERGSPEYPNDSFGYGDFTLWINPAPGGAAVSMDAGQLAHASLHVIINGAKSESGWVMTNNANAAYNTGNIHAEGLTTGFNISAGTSFYFGGALDINAKNVIRGNFGWAGTPNNHGLVVDGTDRFHGLLLKTRGQPGNIEIIPPSTIRGTVQTYLPATTGTLVATPPGVTWSVGSGVPSGSCRTGSLYTRTDGTPGSTLYVCEGGSWAAK